MYQQSKLYFSQKSVESLKILQQSSQYPSLINYLLTDLSYYPYQGRLLFNRTINDQDIIHFRHQLVGLCPQIDVRTVQFQQWLIIYLNHQQHIYLLDFVSLMGEYGALMSIWHQPD